MQFLDLPEELKVTIYGYLPVTILLYHQCVSSSFQRMLEGVIDSFYSPKANHALIEQDNEMKFNDERLIWLEICRRIVVLNTLDYLKI